MGRRTLKHRDGPVGKGPWRTCVGCRAVRRPDDPEAGLVRFVRAGSAMSTEEQAVPIPDGAIPLDPAQGWSSPKRTSDSLSVEVSRYGPGRGAWLCRTVSPDGMLVVNPGCFASATKRRAFAKALRVTQ